MLQFAEEELNSNTYVFHVLMANQLSKTEGELSEMAEILSQTTIGRDYLDAMIKRVGDILILSFPRAMRRALSNCSVRILTIRNRKGVLELHRSVTNIDAYILAIAKQIF